MGCGCKEPDSGKQERIRELLGRIDLRDVFEQASAATEVLGDGLRFLQRAERAERLELGAEVAAMYREAAGRERSQASRQLRTVLRRLDERTGRDDWQEIVERMNAEFPTRDGMALIEEARGRFRFAMLDADGVSAADVVEAVALHDQSLDRLRSDGLDGAVSFVRENLERGLRAVDSPAMGRQPASPLMEATRICISIAVAAAAIALIVCACWPWCWCCYTVVIAAGTAAAVGVCLFEEATGWR